MPVFKAVLALRLSLHVPFLPISQCDELVDPAGLCPSHTLVWKDSKNNQMDGIAEVQRIIGFGLLFKD